MSDSTGARRDAHRLSRRDVLLGAAAGAGLVALGGCSPGSGLAARPVRLERPAAGADPISGRISGEVQGDELEIASGDTLRFDPSEDTTLELRGNLLVRGRLEMKPQPGVQHILRFVDVDESAFVGGGEDPLDSDVGVWVVDGGQLDLRGTNKQAWNRKGTSPTWNRHDELVVAPVEPGDFEPHPFRRGDPVPAFRGHKAEVLNLTRNVRIEGTPNGRAHVFIRSTRPQFLRNAELRHLGPRRPSGEATEGVTGRYPLHFHHSHHGSHGSVVQGVVVRDSGNRGFVVHTSHGVTLRSCIAYEVLDEAYWWDPHDATNDLLVDRCVAAGVHFDPEFRGFRLAGFTLGEGRRLRLQRCVAFGVLGGSNASGFIWPEAPSGLWRFTDNIAHNNAHAGIFVWQNVREPHRIERFTAYNNGEAGISHGAYSNAYHFEDLDLLDQPNAIVLHASGREDLQGRPQSWTDVRATSLSVRQHNLPSVEPVLFLRCSFAEGVTMEDAGGDPGPLDFVECGLQPGDFTLASLHAGTVIRVQNAGGSAYELTGDGVRDIPAFYA